MKGGYSIQIKHDGDGWFWSLMKADRTCAVCVSRFRFHTAEEAEEIARKELFIFAHYAGSKASMKQRVSTLPCSVMGVENAA